MRQVNLSTFAGAIPKAGTFDRWIHDNLNTITNASQIDVIKDVHASGAALSTLNNAVANQVPLYTGATTVTLLTLSSFFINTLASLNSAGAWLAALGGSGSVLGTNNTWTGTNLFQNTVTVDTGFSFNATTINLGSVGHLGTLNLFGSTSGSTAVVPNATASGTLTLPAATDTLIGKATTDTLTNKSFDTAGAGNSLKIAGTAVTAVQGSGAVVLATSPNLTTPNIDSATGSSLLVNGSAGIGYSTGAGGAVTQLTSKSTGVILNKICGQITMFASVLNADTAVSFTVTNSTVAATDTIIVNISGGTSNSHTYDVGVGKVAAGSFDIYLINPSFVTNSPNEGPVLNFAVIKAVNA